MKTPARTKRKEKVPFAFSRRLMEFPEVRGKKLEAVEFSTRPENHVISLRFHDKTMLTFDIEPGFTLFANYADWKTGNYRPIRSWRPVASRLFRE
jgi:hypothetical protein